MQRFASGFATLWLLLFVPFSVIWLLVVRWGETDPDRFASVWNWVVDLIAFPLILSPLTDWSWQQLESGSMLTAPVGFLILNAVWAAIFALPLALISAWWRKIGDWTVRRAATSTSAHVDSYATSAIPIPGRISSSPLAALYVITIPLGLLGAGIKRLGGLFTGSSAGLFWATLGVFAVTFLIVSGFMALMFGFSNFWERDAVLDRVADKMWYGYLDTLRIPKIFDGRWIASMRTIYAVTDETDFHNWPQYMGSWYRHQEFRTVVWVTAARHGLAVVIVFVVWRLLRAATRGAKS